MRKILVTGGAGNVAGSLIEALLENEENFVVIADSLVTSNEQKLPSAEKKNWEFSKVNVNRYSEVEPIFQKHQFDYIFHYAALVGVKRTLENPLLVLDDIEGTKNLLKLAVEHKVKRIFFSSSSEVYGEPTILPQQEETTPLNAKLPYAIVKSVNESFIKSYFQEHGLPYTIFRFFNTYGPRQSQDFVMTKFLKAAINGEDITIFGEGGQTRTFCYVQDNIEVTLKCLYDNVGINDTINVGSDKEMTILELAKAIIKFTNSTSSIIHLPALPQGDMERRCPDNTKMRLILNREMTSMETGFAETLKGIQLN